MLEAKTLRGLYVITPDGVDQDLLVKQVEAALRGGARLVQYRDKNRKAAQQAEIAHALRALCRCFDARFIVNDNMVLARAVDADGVHLGSADGDLVAARQVLGPSKLLGASCYADFNLARNAATAGVDYVAFGAVYPSPTKPQALPASMTLFGRCRAELGVPACAIGGVTLDNSPALISAGADLVAVITDLFEAPDIRSRATAFQKIFEGEQA
ncbi:thiamine phosphate synthase [Propionivibrio sp.]|uniref:thiamine phosphate synthase n=1 Tax=Propionivibrio sp. TaxID=2212460 RepID=UPI0026186DD7|nr:thiamine phosphate synthase [Propionivibrio sp.]